MKVDLAGKIKNTQLPRYKALLPMFEAVVNSFQAIEDAGAEVSSPRIEIAVERDSVLSGLDVQGRVDGFVITDNGIGFDEANLDAFFTSDTQYKVGRGGKGIGRFIWLKAFDRAEIESHYRQNGGLVERTFTFTVIGASRSACAWIPRSSSGCAFSTSARVRCSASPERCSECLQARTVVCALSA